MICLKGRRNGRENDGVRKEQGKENTEGHEDEVEEWKELQDKKVIRKKKFETFIRVFFSKLVSSL
jgi:hypothetical protein